MELFLGMNFADFKAKTWMKKGFGGVDSRFV